MKKEKNISQPDLKDWEEYIKNPKDVFDKDRISKSYKPNDRFKFDLHGFTLEEANTKVKEIIKSCSEKNFKEILLITRKGLHSNTKKNVYVSNDLSKLKYSVPDFIKKNNEIFKLIVSISQAEESEGGKGAIIIRLKQL